MTVTHHKGWVGARSADQMVVGRAPGARLTIAAVCAMMAAIMCVPPTADGRGRDDVEQPVRARGSAGPEGTSAQAGEGNRVLASLGVGEGPGLLGIEHAPEGGPWGPASFDIDDDGAIYIIDGVSGEIEVLGPDGEPTGTLPLPEGVACPVDIDVAASGIFLLDTPLQPPAVHRLDRAGTLLDSWEIPEAYVEQWVSGIRVLDRNGGGEPDVMLELQHAWEVPLVVRGGPGREAVVPLRRSGEVLDMQPDDRASFAVSGRDGRKRFALEKDWATWKDGVAVAYAGTSRLAAMPLRAKGRLGALRFLDTDERGDAFVYAEELGDAVPRAFVKRFASTGAPKTVAEIPVSSRLTEPVRGVRIDPAGEVVALIPTTSTVDVVRLAQTAEESPVLCDDFEPSAEVPTSPDGETASAAPEGEGGALAWLRELLAPEKAHATWERTDAYTRAREYCYNKWYCSRANYIHDGSSVRPRYITSHDRTWQSVPYCWGGWDLPKYHNYLMKLGRDAGDINCTGPGKRSGTSGADCSGLVSRLWALPHKRSTSTSSYYGLGSTEVSYYIGTPGAAGERLGDIYLKPGSHVMMVDYVTLGGARVFESTTWNRYDRVVNPIRAWAGLPGYYVRRNNNWWK